MKTFRIAALLLLFDSLALGAAQNDDSVLVSTRPIYTERLQVLDDDSASQATTRHAESLYGEGLTKDVEAELPPELELTPLECAFNGLTGRVAELASRIEQLNSSRLGIQRRMEDQSKTLKGLQKTNPAGVMDWALGKGANAYGPEAIRDADGIRYPAECLLNELTTERLTLLTRVTAAVYTTSRNTKINEDFERAVDKQRRELEASHDIGFVEKDLELVEEALKALHQLDQHDASAFAQWKEELLSSFRTIGNSKSRNLVGSLESASDVRLVETALQTEKTELSKDKMIKVRDWSREGIEENPHVQALMDTPAFRDLGNMEILRVLYRNGNEFSGVILYDEGENEVIVVYAGSKSMLDWFNNFRFWGSPGDVGLNIGGGDKSFHAGVTRLLTEGLADSVRDFGHWMENKYTSTKPLKVLTMGHSLGGALSTMIAEHIKKELLPKHQKQHPTLAHAVVQNISFGAPRYQDPRAALECERVLGKGNILRFWNVRDLVPFIVFGALNSKHTGVSIPLQDSVWREVYMPIITHHQMSRYWELAARGLEEFKRQAAESDQIDESIDTMGAQLAAVDAALHQAGDELAEARLAVEGFDPAELLEIIAASKETASSIYKRAAAEAKDRGELSTDESRSQARALAEAIRQRHQGLVELQSQLKELKTSAAADAAGEAEELPDTLEDTINRGWIPWLLRRG